MPDIKIQPRQDPSAVDRILRSLPEWFGVEEAILGYTASASRQESFLAVVNDMTVGVALLTRHFKESAELTLIAVDAKYRGRGVGKTLLEAMESALIIDGCQLLQVHTVGPSFEDAAYSQTRAFYRKFGFLPVQEFERIDWDGPTLVMVKLLIQKSAR
ncbi:GNAT family N-acetyltransferase [Arthrobacter cryoconiti]|uniref:GNAT family N-acetyltransferase n=1 Tax=Arthrobacter cryoconiti TaxID=748907 RepID=A0ABV8QY38_9MICC|nr:GNAT family N-acetyltransferase [Arthrobacter cryoconiti]MCC9069546.1 GNAT family N-acetyltransferase [Arthrobacter cryoconiti]